MNLVALLIAAVISGIGAPIVVQYLSTPIKGTAELSAQASASAFAESLQWRIRRQSGSLEIQDNGRLLLHLKNGEDELYKAPPGCSFVAGFNGASGIFLSCFAKNVPATTPSVVSLASAKYCESQLFPVKCEP